MIFLVFVEGRHVRWCLINVIPDLCNHWRGICAKLRRSKEFEDDVLEPWQKKTISHGIHVWYIYLHVVHFCGKRERGKFSLHGCYGYMIWRNASATLNVDAFFCWEDAYTSLQIQRPCNNTVVENPKKRPMISAQWRCWEMDEIWPVILEYHDILQQ